MTNPTNVIGLNLPYQARNMLRRLAQEREDKNLKRKLEWQKKKKQNPICSTY